MLALKKTKNRPTGSAIASKIDALIFNGPATPRNVILYKLRIQSRVTIIKKITFYQSQYNLSVKK